jgi:hypothetical protein
MWPTASMANTAMLRAATQQFLAAKVCGHSLRLDGIAQQNRG